MNKEQIYDEQISPLMAEIIAICQKHKIAMLASFALPTEADLSLKCTTAILTDDCDPPIEMKVACRKLFRGTLFPLIIKRNEIEEKL